MPGRYRRDYDATAWKRRLDPVNVADSWNIGWGSMQVCSRSVTVNQEAYSPHEALRSRTQRGGARTRGYDPWTRVIPLRRKRPLR